MVTYRCITALGVLMLLPPPPAAAQGVDPDAIRASKRAVAVRIIERITIDGIPDEPVWQRAEPATDFLQQQPAEFQPATRRTEVRFLYDETTLYVGAVLYDEAPRQAITNDLKRDFNGRDGDLFGVVLDTFHDRRNSYGFLTNPGGALRDTLASDGGRRNDPNWHGVWVGRTAVHDDSWTVEFAIPFKTLRFPPLEEQNWGLNIVRIVRRANEVSTWSPVPHQFSHYQVAYAGTLRGIRNVVPGRNLQIKPFATGTLERRGGSAGSGTSMADGGADLKWAMTSSLALDATWRTDFSQVEADEQQINLTRFSLFFPEKREFFLESPASFQIGISEPDVEEPRRDLVPFFSRRIGLSSTGQPIPVEGGLRVTGRAGRQVLGLLAMRTEDFEGGAGDTFTAARVARSVSASVEAGAFYFARESTGIGGYNRVGGFDVRVAPRRTLELEAVGMRSVTAGADGAWAGRAGLRLDTQGHRARAGLVHVGDSFRHDLGFVRRRGVATVFGRYARLWQPRDPSSPVREHSAGMTFETTADAHYSRWLTGVGTLNYRLLFADGGELSALVGRTFERLEAPFLVGSNITIGRGEYRFTDGAVKYTSNRSAPLSGSLEAGGGEFWTGTRRSVTGAIRLRFSGHAAASATFSRSDLNLPQGTFTGDLLGMRLDYSFSPRMFLNAFVQYNGDSQTWLSNVRYNFVHRPLSDIYIVWNETRAGGIARRALLLKYTHLLVP